MSTATKRAVPVEVIAGDGSSEPYKLGVDVDKVAKQLADILLRNECPKLTRAVQVALGLR